ncbi:MAG TPA: AAA family ATPase [Clostridia bacterium]|nr:AAA family ATPase [Clostridia bacterium]
MRATPRVPGLRRFRRPRGRRPLAAGALVAAALVLLLVGVAFLRPAGGSATAAQVTIDPGSLQALEQVAGTDGKVYVITGGTVAGSSDPLRLLTSLLIPLALLGVLAFFVLRIHRSNSAGRDSSSGFRTFLPADAGDPGPRPGADGAMRAIGLADVAGCDEAKLELTEMIEFLRAPERFRQLGAHIPRGVMLFGPPGTGKTMLARAVAAEAAVPFHYASGSEFVEKFVGVGARRVRELFAGARKLGRGVIFIDEFDAIGRSRGGANSHEEREQTLNQLLIELDGFSTTDEIVVIAATNRLDILDPAVLRPGRFNRKIHVGLPDVAGRRAILAVHAERKPLGADVDLDALARRTYGFSGAQLSDLLNEAAIMAARRGAEAIEAADIHAGWLKVAVGTSRRRSMDQRERSIIAAHEIGHAICGRVHGDKRTVEEISLFAHGDALGVTVSSQEDNDLPSESDLRARLVALMGGRAAEELLFHDVTGGAGDDFEKANRLATIMVNKWGMGRDPEAEDGGTSGRGDLGFLVSGASGSMPSGVQGAATRAIRAILDEAYETAYRTLVEHVATLRRLAAYLVEHERLDGETFSDLFEGRIEVPRATDEWRPATARPRPWDEVATHLDRRFRRVAAPAPVAIAATAPAAGAPAPSPVPVVAPVRASEAAPVPGMARRRSGLRRRLRQLAAGYLEQAEAWLLAPEGETDRR